MWQFIPSTGRRYGLQQNSGTTAAATFPARAALDTSSSCDSFDS
jgi:hypothetical protein